MQEIKKYQHDNLRLQRHRLVTITSNQSLSKVEMELLDKSFMSYSAFNVAFYHGHPTSYKVDICVTNKSGESYSIDIANDGMKIEATQKGLLYAIVTLSRLMKNNELYVGRINDEPDLEVRGYYYDVTRGRIPTLETLKALADDLLMVKGNQLQLYIEHSFLYQEHPELSAGADGLSALDIKAFDDYCYERNIELVPSIASFGHLYHLLKLPQHNELCELDNKEDVKFSWIDRMNHHTVNTVNDDSIILIENILRPFMGLFRSKQFNICADETFDLGKGKSKNVVEEIGEGKVYLAFLKKIMHFMDDYGYQVMFWGDILLKSPEEIVNLPKNVICLNWLYAKEPDENKVKCFDQVDVTQILCPAVWGWNRMVNNYDLAIGNIETMINYANKYKTLGVLITDWGDYGHINNPIFSRGLRHYSLLKAWNNEVDLGCASRSSYGHDRIIDLLSKISESHLITWLEITWWQEHAFGKTRGNEKYYSIAMERIDAITESDVMEQSLSLEELLNEFLEISNDDRLNEAVRLAISGINLFNELALAIASKNKNTHLGDEWLWWFDAYRKKWLETDRESEVNQFYDAVRNITSYLKS